MDVVDLSSVLPKTVLYNGLRGFVRLQQYRSQNYFRSNWDKYEWDYVYDDPASLTFFFDAQIRDEMTGREEIDLQYFSELAEHHDAMLDMGAHMGSVSVILGVLNPEVPLHCFEPVTSNIRILQKNLRSNTIDATVHEAVIGNESGSVTFYEQIDDETRKLHLFDNTVAHSSSATYENNERFQSVEKPAIDLFDFCDENGISCPFLKIDIEGGEHSVMERLLHGDHELKGFSAIVELHPDLIEDGTAHDIVLWLEEQKIDIEWVKTRNPRRMALYCSTVNM